LEGGNLIALAFKRSQFLSAAAVTTAHECAHKKLTKALWLNSAACYNCKKKMKLPGVISYNRKRKT